MNYIKDDTNKLYNENFIIVDRKNDEIFINIEDKYKTLNDLNNFFNLKFTEKIAYLKNITNLIELYKIDFLNLLKEILKYDNLCIQIKNELIINIENILIWMKKYKINFDLNEEIINFIKNCLFEKNFSIKNKMKITFSNLINYFDNKLITLNILPMILELLHDDHTDNILIGIELMIYISELISKEMLEIYISTDILNLSNNENYRVRIAAFESLINISHLFSEDFIENKINNNIIRLIMDKEIYVSIIFINKIIEIKIFLKKTFFEKQIYPHFIEFLKHKNVFIKDNAISKIGLLLANSKGNSYFDSLLNAYLRIYILTKNRSNKAINDCIIPNISNLHKILSINKLNRWDEFKFLLIKILDCGYYKINLEIAKNVYWITKILTKDILEQEFLPIIFKYLLNDNIDQNIKNEVIYNLAYILDLINNDKRDKYADLFLQIQNDIKNWRIRYMITDQFNIISQLFSKEILKFKIYPICLKLCKDNVSKVRLNSCANLFYLFLNQSNHDIIDILIENIKFFADYNNFIIRQSFILICNGIILYNWKIFFNNFLNLFKNLAKDKIPNVRIALVKVLYYNLNNLNDSEEDLKKRIILIDIFNEFNNDNCKEVIFYYNKYFNIKYEDKTIITITNNSSLDKTVKTEDKSESSDTFVLLENFNTNI